jgi:imidazoleglycerol phosphate synthase glutamine amidotransferase subunit HisH
MIAIADYGMGNRRSVEKALAHVGAESVITADVSSASAIILPGVGAFPEAMRNLERTGLGEVLVERAQAGVPLLGICSSTPPPSTRARAAWASCPARSPASRAPACRTSAGTS